MRFTFSGKTRDEVLKAALTFRDKAGVRDALTTINAAAVSVERVDYIAELM